MEENKSYKIIGRNSKTNLQEKKRVYTSEKDFLQYKDDLIKRYKRCYGIAEVYELVGGKWKLFEEKKLADALEMNPNWFINGQEAIKSLENVRYGTNGDEYKALTYSIELIRGLIDKNSC